GVEIMDKKKRTVIILTVLFSVLLITVIAYKAYPSIAIKPALCKKYGWEKSDIKIIKHKNAHYEHDFGFFVPDMQDLTQ
ncbi:MAG: hypothetical protein K6C14_06845, partial [Eubacterium sp.]|nr:hypothetical protein [Eubacterium sp.]